MKNLSLLFINIGLFIIMLPIIDWLKKRKSGEQSHGTPKLGFLSIAATLIATELGASLLLSSSHESFYTACYGLFYIIGISIGYLILGAGLAAHMRAAQCNSSAEYLARKYNSATLQKLSSFLSIMILYAFLVGELIATKTLLQGLGLTSEIIFISLWLLLVLYCSVGGLLRIGISHFAQLSYFGIVFCGIFVYCLFKKPPSWDTVTFFIAQQETLPLADTNIFSLLLSLFSTIIYCISEQDVNHPLFAKKTRFIQFATTGGAGLFMILFSLMPLFFCFQAQSLHLEIPSGLSPIIPVIQYLTNDCIVFLMLCGIIIAITATFDYLFSAIGDYWVDELTLLKKGNIPNSKSIITLVNGTLIMLISYLFSTDMLSIFNISFELYTCVLLVPLFFAYVKKDVKRISAWGAIGGGIISFIICNYGIINSEKEIIHLIFSLTGYAFGSLLNTALLSKKIRPILIRN